jgi:hyaluronan synthase
MKKVFQLQHFFRSVLRNDDARIGNDMQKSLMNQKSLYELERLRGRDIWYESVLFGVAFFLLGIIIVLKGKTAAAAENVDGVLLFYTFFVTTFQISRLIASLMYTSSYDRALSSTEADQSPYTPKISFVIPAYNEEGEIQNTIQNCLDARYPRDLTEVIVINDCSTDSTREKILEMKNKNPEIIFVDWTVNKGKRHGMAEGFRRATGEIVIQLDSDSRIDPRDIPQVVEPFRNPNIGAVSYNTEPANSEKNLLTKMQTAYYFLSFRILKAAESTFRMVFCCSGCASAYRREIVLPLLDDWLTESFLGLPVTWGDDRSITNRVIKLGYETIYSNHVRAYTIVPEKLPQFIKQQIRWKKGWFVNSFFASKFVFKRDPFVALTYFFPLTVVTLLTPFMAARAFLYTPFVHGISSTGYYMLGVLAIAGLFFVFYRFYSRENRYHAYIFVWAILNMLILSYMLIIALFTIQNRGWGTRSLVDEPSSAS